MAMCLKLYGEMGGSYAWRSLNLFDTLHLTPACPMLIGAGDGRVAGRQ